jgi:hypothetical protein
MIILNWLWARYQAQPIYAIGLLRAILIASVSFGFKLTPAQIGGVLLVSEALASFATQTQVTPVASLQALLDAATTETTK